MDIGVLTFVTAGLTIWSVRAWYRVFARRDVIGRRGGGVWFAGVFSVLALTAGYFELAHHQRQQLATEALEVLSDVDGISANCERFTEELFNLSQYSGYVYYDGSNTAHLKRNICHDLWDYAHGGQARPTEGQVLAVHVVGHEAMHVNGIFDEAVAECTAVQLNHLIAEELGATPNQARGLQRMYFQIYYPNQRDNYVSGECREGGSLDLFPDRTEFP